MTFAAALFAARANHGISQSKLALAIDLDHSMISRYESGSRMPTRQTLTAMADVLELEGVERMLLWSAAGMVETALTRDEAEMLTGMRE